MGGDSPVILSVIASVEAEQAVLGALLGDPETAGPLVDAVALRAQDFEDADHARIFTAIQVLRATGRPGDVYTVREQLQGMGFDAALINLVYLNELAQSVPSGRNAGRYAQIVRDKAQRREIQTAALALGRAVSAGGGVGDEQALRSASELIEQLRAIVQPPAKESGLPIEWARELPDDAQVPEQLIEGVFTVGGLSAVCGPSNSGKSFLMAHIALCLDHGVDFLGVRRVKRAPVLYVAAEGASTMRARFQADGRHFDRRADRLAMVSASLNLLEPSADIDALIATARQIQQQVGEPLGLIVIDTLARVMAGGDENAAVDMGRLIGGCDRLREATGAHVALVHHMGKDLSRGARGHSSLRAALDTEIEVSVDEATRTHHAKVTKQRDLASKGETFGFKLVPVELGVDQWGGAVTSCAVVASEVGIGTPAPRKLTASQQAVMGYLSGQDQGVRRAQVVKALEPQGVSKSRAYAALTELQIAGLVVEVQGLVYMPKGAAE